MSAAGEGAAGRRLIIVGIDDSAEAGAAAHWAVREAELRNDDLLLVHAYEVPLLPTTDRAAAIAQESQERRAMLDKAGGTLTVPPTMHLDQLIEIDTPESLLPLLSEQAELTVLGHDHPSLGRHMPFGHTASTVASLSRHPVVAVPRRWTVRADDRRAIAVAVDGLIRPRVPSASPSPRRACAKFQCWLFTRYHRPNCRQASRTPGSIWPRSWPAGRLTIPTST